MSGSSAKASGLISSAIRINFLYMCTEVPSCALPVLTDDPGRDAVIYGKV
jgi:hypothetical protein